MHVRTQRAGVQSCVAPELRRLSFALTFPAHWRGGARSLQRWETRGSLEPLESRHSVTWQEYSSAQLAWLLAPSCLKSVFGEGFLSKKGSSF